jgi:hypothetical protein
MNNEETVLLSNNTSSCNIEHIACQLRYGQKIIGKGKPPTTTHSRRNCSCAYLLESAGYYKIGVTLDTSIDKRIRALQTGNPHKINLVAKTKTITAAYDIEKQLQKKFKPNIVRGEWFKLTDKELKFVTQTFKDASK